MKGGLVVGGAPRTHSMFGLSIACHLHLGR